VSAVRDRLAAALADRYLLERELGQGGMATVYLAEDLKHHRKVAVKVLRPELAATMGSQRFFREIEVAAQLQHPHILPLHDSGEAEGFLYYVMPYVEGDSLRDRLAHHGELAVHEAIKILSEVVDALAYAHSRGVVHRDIKPDNIMLSGRHALVTDFGVAKAVSEATGRQTLTTTGMALGTPIYMAPEQAAADPHLDHRVDIYAVGVLAYELLTGRPPFTGPTPQRVLAAHLTEPPEPLTKHRPTITPALARVVMKCLAKRPADRWQSADELLGQLEPLLTPSGGTTPTAARLQLIRVPGRRMSLLAAGLILVALLVAGTLLLTRSRAPALMIGRAAQFATEAGLEVYPAISPDGRVVAYAAGNSARMRIFLRPVSGGRTLTLSNDTSAVESQPRWSPDGEQILFLSRGSVYVASSFGGAARQVVSRSTNMPVVAAAWSPDGKEIAVVRGDSLLVYSADGTGGRFVVPTGSRAGGPRGAEWHSCVWSPTRIWLACVAGNGRYAEPGAFFANLSPSAIVLVAVSEGRIVPVTDSAALHQSPQWSKDGSRLFFVSSRDGPRDIYALIIRSNGRPLGKPARITTGLGVQSFSLDASGRRLAYAVYRETANVWSLPIPKNPPVSIDGAVQVTSGSQVIESMHVSSDNRWLYYDSDLHGNVDIYRISMTGGEPERLTSDPADDFDAETSPDGTEIAFHSFRTGARDVFVQSVTGGQAHQVTATPTQECCPAWSPDGAALAYADFSGGGFFVVRRDSTGRWGPPVHRPSPSSGLFLEWSPDGRRIARTSGRTIRGVPWAERLELVLPDSGAATTLYAVADTVNDPNVSGVHWSRDGRGVYFKSHDDQGRASIWYQALSGGRPRLIVRFDDLSRPSFRGSFDLDGGRFFFAINDRQSDIWVAEVA
jgi:eukaryotic-like serine/threonine-protein kinase